MIVNGQTPAYLFDPVWKEWLCRTTQCIYQDFLTPQLDWQNMNLDILLAHLDIQDRFFVNYHFILKPGALYRVIQNLRLPHLKQPSQDFARSV